MQKCTKLELHTRPRYGFALPLPPRLHRLEVNRRQSFTTSYFDVCLLCHLRISQEYHPTQSQCFNGTITNVIVNTHWTINIKTLWLHLQVKPESPPSNIQLMVCPVVKSICLECLWKFPAWGLKLSFWPMEDNRCFHTKVLEVRTNKLLWFNMPWKMCRQLCFFVSHSRLIDSLVSAKEIRYHTHAHAHVHAHAHAHTHTCQVSFISIPVILRGVLYLK